MSHRSPRVPPRTTRLTAPLRAIAWIAVVFAVFSAVLAAQSQGKEAERAAMARALAEQRNMDARVGLLVKSAVPLDLQQGEVDGLRAAMPDLRVEFDSSTGATKSLWNMADYLTPPDGRRPRAIAEDFILSRAALLGLADSDIVDMELTDEVYSAISGVTHLYYRQRIGSISVYNGQLQVHVTRDGRILSVNNGFLPNLTAAIASLRPALSADAAVTAAGEHLGVRGVVPAIRQVAADLQQTTELSAPELSRESIKAQLMVLPVAKGQARLVWNFQVWTLDAAHAFDLTVDAETGQVWTRFDWVAADTYRVYPQPVESPNHTTPAPPADGRTLVSNPADATASPFGWHDTNGVAGAEFTTTEGNNASAYTDVDANNVPDVGSSPNCGVGLACDFAVDLTQAPSAYRPAAVTNLFYWNNIIHDVQHRYGFDEPAGSFQVNNYGRGGLGNDSVQAEAQDGSGTNNANFSTPPDGSRPRMQMYTWNTVTPNRDGDLDAGIIVHEYGHGISNRLVGGPSNVSCLQNAQQPGEGISDWLSLVYTALPSHTGPQARGVGTYALNQPTTGPGIRALPYSTDGAVNNWTYASITSMIAPHGVGSVWAQGMWEVYWALVNEYGFNADLYNATGGAGNQRAMLYHNEGLKNTACSPGFTQVRDGIIAAAQTINAGADVCRLWTAFAAFGLGADAVNPSANSNAGIVNGFNVPAACGGSVVPTMNIGDATVTEGHTGTTTATFTVTLNTSSTSEIRASFATVAGTAASPSDYTVASGQVIFAAGQTSRTVQVAVNGDLTTEPDETFTVNLTAPVNAVLGDASGLGTIANDDGFGSVVIPADAATLGSIPDSSSGTCQVPGAPRDVTFTVAALTGTPSGVELSASLTHTFVGDLVARLTAPGGANHVIFGYTGATSVGGAGSGSDLNGAYSFRDSSANNWWTAVASTPVLPGDYRTAQLGGAGATSTPTSMNPVFAAVSPNGTWTLRLTDGCSLDVGSVSAAALTLIFPSSTPPTTVGDSYTATVNTTLTVAAPGVLANDTSNGGGAMSAELVSGPSLGALALNTNGGFTYTPNAGASGTDTFTYRALAGGGAGNVATVTISVGGLPTTVADSFTTTYPTALNVAAPGVLANDASNGGGALTAVLVSNPVNGTLTLGASGSVSYTPSFGFAGTDTFTYRAQNPAGAGNVVTVTITVAPPTNVQAPYNLRVDSVVGTTVTLRWDALPIGPQATVFVLEGGLAPGQVLASIPTGSAAPIYTFTAPVGSFFIRMHGQSGSDKSPASNEVPLHVGVPVTPSAPAGLLGLVNGSTLDLSWKNTFGGGPATGLMLDVTGSAALSLPLGVSEHFSFTPVPGGSYTFRVRQTNPGGAGPSSDPVTLSFPSACTGAPQAPTNFLGYRIGATAYVVWDPPAGGAAPTGYVLDVSGSFVGSFGTAGRALSGGIGPGSYNVRVQAVNGCGLSPFTAVQVISLP